MSSKDKNLDIKGNQLKPLIMELEEQNKSQNQSLIKKMIKQNNSNVKFASGFKNNNSSLRETKKQLYRPETSNQPQIITNVYNQLGVSKAQSKYRLTDQNYQPSKADNYSIKQLEAKVQLLKKERYQKNSHLLNKIDQFTMVNNNQRFQNVVHAQSSLDAITIQNIEAKLEVHRRGLKAVQDQYNAKKGKQSALDRYGYMKVNIDVDKEYSQMQIDNNKVYQLVKNRQNLQPHEVQFEQLWQQKKRNNPKLAEYDQKYQQYLVTKDAKNIIGTAIKKNLYSWDKYTQPLHNHKQKHIHLVSHSPQKDHKHSLSKNKSVQQQPNYQKFGPDGLQSIKDIKDVIAKKDDKFIASYIFAQLDTSKIGLISKQQLNEYILSQKHIINGYNIDTKWLYTDLDNFQTKRKGLLTKAQLSLFLASLQKMQHPQLTLSNVVSAQINQNKKIQSGKSKSITKNKIISSFDRHRDIFEKLFNVLDFNDDKIIKRAEFIQNIFIDSDCVKILDQQVLKIPIIEKSITFRQIIGCILDDYTNERNQKLKKSKQYITFKRFCEYFELPESLDLSRINKNEQRKKKHKSIQIQMYDLPQEYLQLFKDIFNQIPRIYQDYIVSVDFVQSALRDPQILALSDQLCRIASVQTVLPLQSIITTLKRMLKQCDQYSSWEDIKVFFSRRGRPLDWDFQLIQKKKQIRNKKLKQKRAILHKQKIINGEDDLTSTIKLRDRSKQRVPLHPNKYTVPQPFNITDMNQKPELQEVAKGQKEFQELKKQRKQFKANPVNKQILQPKPDLIAGLSTKKSQEKYQYKYENYQNDRIERALKRAQQKYEINEKTKEIKQKTQIKATEIGVDLTKKYIDVIKQQQKKKRQGSNYKPTKPNASQSLYPKDPKGQKQRKLQKIKQNMQKAEQISKRKNDQLQQQRRKAKQKNMQVKKVNEQMKLQQLEQKKKQDQLANKGLEFKPKINKKQISAQQAQLIAKSKAERQKKLKQEEQEKIRIKQQLRNKRLGYDKKSIFLSIDDLNQEQILDKLDEINFEDLLLDDKDRQNYRKQYDNKNKTLKQLKQREKGLAGRQRAAMQEQEKRIMEQKKIYKQKVQKQKTNPKQNFSKLSTKGQAAYKNDLQCHKSKALRRYRAIMQGKKPLSQFDKYSQIGQSDEKLNNSIFSKEFKSINQIEQNKNENQNQNQLENSEKQINKQEQQQQQHQQQAEEQKQDQEYQFQQQNN